LESGIIIYSNNNHTAATPWLSDSPPHMDEWNIEFIKCRFGFVRFTDSNNLLVIPEPADQPRVIKPHWLITRHATRMRRQRKPTE